MSKRASYSILILLMVLSLSVKLIFVTFFMDSNKYYWEDTIHYYGAAKSLASEGNFGTDPERPKERRPYGLEPVYPLFLAPLLLLFPSGFLAIRLVQSIVIVASAFPFYKIMRLLVHRKLALFGATLYLFYPFYVFFSGVVLPEAIYLPALVLFVYLVLMYVCRHGPKYLYLSVALLAVMGHLKVTSWSLGIVMAVAFLAINHRLNKQFLIRAVACTLIFLAICLPWGVRNYAIHGKIGLPRNRLTGLTGGGSTETIQVLSERFSLRQNILLLFSPGLTRVNSVNEFSRSPYKCMSVAVVTPLLIATAILLFFRRDRLVLFLYVVFFSYCLPYLLLRGQTRYRLPIDFVMILFFAILLSLCPWFARKDGQTGCDFNL